MPPKEKPKSKLDAEILEGFGASKGPSMEDIIQGYESLSGDDEHEGQLHAGMQESCRLVHVFSLSSLRAPRPHVGPRLRGAFWKRPPGHASAEGPEPSTADFWADLFAVG